MVKGTSSTANRHALFAEVWRGSGSAVRARRHGGNSEIAGHVSPVERRAHVARARARPDQAQAFTSLQDGSVGAR